MKHIFLASMAVLLLFFAGCITMPGATPEKGNEAAGQAAGEQEAGAVEEAIEGAIGNLGEAVARNAPLECTATVTVDGANVASHYWTKGGNVRTETQTNGQEVVTILKNKKIYIQASAFGGMPSELGCDWIEISEEESKPEAETYSAAAGDYSDMANVKVDCNPGVFGDEKFETPGKICTLDDLIPQTVNLPPGYEACAGLSGQALMDCMQQNQPG